MAESKEKVRKSEIEIPIGIQLLCLILVLGIVWRIIIFSFNFFSFGTEYIEIIQLFRIIFHIAIPLYIIHGFIKLKYSAWKLSFLWFGYILINSIYINVAYFSGLLGIYSKMIILLMILINILGYGLIIYYLYKKKNLFYKKIDDSKVNIPLTISIVLLSLLMGFCILFLLPFAVIEGSNQLDGMQDKTYEKSLDESQNISQVVIDICKEKENIECHGDCEDGLGTDCYFDSTKYNKDELVIGIPIFLPEEIKGACFAMYSSSICGDCYNKFELKKDGEFKEISCEEFFQAIEEKNIECNDCLDMIQSGCC
ncbi:MAG: hypothetical protein KAI55_03915 [Candidatus Aenigmarchaeota archaeon]|nr:hypothetical protein [Candidatus Aenigmarchaeota archaeon]